MNFIYTTRLLFSKLAKRKEKAGREKGGWEQMILTQLVRNQTCKQKNF